MTVQLKYMIYLAVRTCLKMGGGNMPCSFRCYLEEFSYRVAS